jgi:hypothetical protein
MGLDYVVPSTVDVDGVTEDGKQVEVHGQNAWVYLWVQIIDDVTLEIYAQKKFSAYANIGNAGDYDRVVERLAGDIFVWRADYLKQQDIVANQLPTLQTDVRDAVIALIQG